MRRLVAGLVALIAFGALGGYVAGAVTRDSSRDGATGSLALLVVIRSGAQNAVDVSSPVDVASADFLLSVPRGHHDLFDVRFSGSVSFPNGPAFPVAVDVTVDGIAMDPSGLPAWPNAATSPLPFQLERAIGPLPQGNYQIGIRLTGASPYDHRLVQLLGWTLVSQRTSQNPSKSTTTPTAPNTPGPTSSV